MLRNHNYAEEFPVKGKRITFAYESVLNQRNFTIRRLPFLSIISVGNQLSEQTVLTVMGVLCEYESEYDAMDRFMQSHGREYAKRIGCLESYDLEFAGNLQ